MFIIGASLAAVTAASPQASRQAAVEAAPLVLEQMRLSRADLTAVPQFRKPAPTFAEYDAVGAALRCLYQRAVENGLITAADNPARKVAKPRRMPFTRRAVPGTRLAEINQAAAATGDDPAVDTLLLADVLTAVTLRHSQTSPDGTRCW